MGGMCENLASLKPTVGCERSTIYLEEQKLLVFDMGGQDTYRKSYIDQPDRFFLGTDVMVFMIDIQEDSENFQLALDYLTQILNVVKFLGESPEFIVPMPVQAEES